MAFEEYAGSGHSIGRLMYYLYPHSHLFDHAHFMDDGETIMNSAETEVWAKYGWDENDEPLFDFYNDFEYLNAVTIEVTTCLAELERMIVAVREGKNRRVGFQRLVF